MLAENGNIGNILGQTMTGLNGGDGEGTVTDTVLNYLENRPVPVQVHNVNNSGSIELEYTVL